jgi:hypothetical protein
MTNKLQRLAFWAANVRSTGAQRQAARGTQGVAAQLVCLVSVVHCILMLAPELRRRLSLA